MKNKKHSRKHEESSSSSGSDNETDSSSSSSQSRESSPAPKKNKKELKEEVKQDKGRKYKTSDDEQDHKNARKLVSDNESFSRAKHNTVEQSKWDSPREKLERRDKKSERYRRSVSKEHSRLEKKHELEKYHRDHKYDQSRDYSNNKNEERYRHDRRTRKYDDREYQNERYDKKDRRDDRDEYYKDKNRRERNSKMDDHFTKRYNQDKGSSADQSRSRSDSHQNRYRNRSHRSRSRSLDATDVKWGKDGNDKSNAEKSKEKEKPNFGLSGKLTEETNTYRGIVIKYSEPPEARKPKRRWRLYPFKGEKALQTLYIHRESAYLIGRERKIVDLPVDHPSCSKQHAVLQYRLVPFIRDDGSQGKKVRPYLIDLESANGTFINNKKIESRKYVELLEKDVIKFGYSSREYVLLHENSKDEAQDDDVKEEEVHEAVKTEKE